MRRLRGKREVLINVPNRKSSEIELTMQTNSRAFISNNKRPVKNSLRKLSHTLNHIINFRKKKSPKWHRWRVYFDKVLFICQKNLRSPSVQELSSSHQSRTAEDTDSQKSDGRLLCASFFSKARVSQSEKPRFRTRTIHLSICVSRHVVSFWNRSRSCKSNCLLVVWWLLRQFLELDQQTMLLAAMTTATFRTFL